MENVGTLKEFGQVQFGMWYSLISLKQQESKQTSRKPIDFVTKAAFCGLVLMDAFQTYSFISSKSATTFLEQKTDSAAVTLTYDRNLSVFSGRWSQLLHQIPYKSYVTHKFRPLESSYLIKADAAIAKSPGLRRTRGKTVRYLVSQLKDHFQHYGHKQQRDGADLWIQDAQRGKTFDPNHWSHKIRFTFKLIYNKRCSWS